FGVRGARGYQVPFAELDTSPKDGKVTLEELKNYYRRSGLAPVQVQAAAGQGDSDAMTEVLFKYLDRNQDGQLSREEVAGAVESLYPLDLNEDEMISRDELVPTVNPGNRLVAQPFPAVLPPPENAAVLVLGADESPMRLVQQLLQRYDRDKNQKLS